MSLRWLGALVLAALVAVGCYHLGWWQYHKHEAKTARNALLDRHYRAAPVPYDTVLTSRPVPPADDWTRVSVRGSYTAGPLFVRGRPRDGEVGLEVVWALTPQGGGTPVLVDRGWVASSAEGARVLPTVPVAPSGVVDVVGWVRPGEAARGGAADGSIASLSLVEASRSLSTPLLDGYVLLDRESVPGGATPPRPEPLGDPDRDLGPHLAYAYQWWLAMSVGFVLVGFGIRREERLAHPEKYPPKEKKVRIWDEEDE